jgi:gas vesicle protein
MANRIADRNTAAALIAGALVGAGAALLFAPQSGRRTRQDIKLFAEKVGNKADAARIQLQRSVDNIIGEAEDKILDAMNHGKEWTDSRMTELRRVLNTVRKAVSGEIKAA